MSTNDVVGNLLAESGLAGDAALAAVLTDLRELATGPSPEPSPQLAVLLAGDAPGETAVLPAPVVPLSRRRRAALGVSAVALAAVTSTGVAAAANQLPTGAQRVAARFSDQFLPFSFPLPRDSGPLTPEPLEPQGGGSTHRPAAQGTAPPATLDPGAATPSADHPAARQVGEPGTHRTRGRDHDHHGDVGGGTADGREEDGTQRRDRDGSQRSGEDRSDVSERSGGTDDGSRDGRSDGAGSDGGTRSGPDDGGTSTSVDSGASGGPDQGSGGGTDLPGVVRELPR